MSLRLFVAVDPPPELAAEIASWARAARGPRMRVMSPERIHLTLAFLGAMTEHDVGPIAGAIDFAVAETLGGPIELELGAPAWLPPRRPRALAVEVRDPSGRLAELRDALAEALAQTIGWEPEHRRFRPHLTAARMSGEPPGRTDLAPTPAASFTVAELVLYRSFLEPHGARYEALERTPLALEAVLDVDAPGRVVRPAAAAGMHDGRELLVADDVKLQQRVADPAEQAPFSRAQPELRRLAPPGPQVERGLAER